MDVLPEPNSLTYEQALAELEAIITALEANDGTLEILLARYERGQALARRCTELLDQADLRIRQISGEGLVSFEAQA